MAPMNSRMGKELFYKRAKTVWGDITRVEVYGMMINDFISFMKGRSQAVEDFFQMEMNKAAERKDFEQAAWIRDRLKQLKKMMVKQTVVTPSQEDIDAISYYGQKNKGVASILIIRSGKLMDIKFFDLKINGEVAGIILNRIIIDYYQLTDDWPGKIYCSQRLLDDRLIKGLLFGLSGKKIKIFYPQRGIGLKMIRLAERNAKSEFQRKSLLTDFVRNHNLGLQDLLRSLVGGEKFDAWWQKILVKKDFRIEAYDISNFGEKGVVGAMVTWEIKQKSDKKDFVAWEGGFKKSYYKRFTIKSFQGQNDFLAMREIFGRRFKHREEGWQWPDLILIDGGKGQLSSAIAVLAELEVDLPTISLAKKEEEVWLGQRNEDEINFKKIDIEKDSMAGLLLREIRDEIHRFVIGFQRKTRTGKMQRSILDEISGLGPKTKKKLLSIYGSVTTIRETDEVDLAKVVGKIMAEKIRKKLGEI